MSLEDKLAEAAQRLRSKAEGVEGGALTRIQQLEGQVRQMLAEIDRMRVESKEQHEAQLAEADERHGAREEAALAREAAFEERLETVITMVLGMVETVEHGVETVRTFGGDREYTVIEAHGGGGGGPAAEALAEARRQIGGPTEPPTSGDPAFPAPLQGTMAKLRGAICLALAQAEAAQVGVRAMAAGQDIHAVEAAMTNAYEAVASEMMEEMGATEAEIDGVSDLVDRALADDRGAV